ncbi:MAG TPA: hypothetical protein VFE58_09160 [Tepidisphaeraceae bacterium]|nr:hypothetical protein [Tepidisphaeraceae bacterium]
MLLEGLHAIVTTDAQLSPAERKATITSVTTELTKVRAMKQALSAMASSQPSQASALSNRINTLQAENQRLSMALSAKEARRQALQNAIAQTRSQIKLDQQTDPVIEQLRTVVKLRDDEVKHLDAMRRAGVATDSEYAEAQAKLAEARVKLAEREASAGKAGKGELLDRLADEMTMTIVDFTDLQIQLDHVRDELHSLNPSSATTQSLEEILKNGTIPQGKDANNLPPLFGQLEERERSLVHEKVILEIDDVEPVAESH